MSDNTRGHEPFDDDPSQSGAHRARRDSEPEREHPHGPLDDPHLPGSGKEDISPVSYHQESGSMQSRGVGMLPPEAAQLSVEKKIDLDQKSYSQGQLIRRRFVRHTGAMVSLLVLLAIAFTAITSIGWGNSTSWWHYDGWWHYGYTQAAPIYNTLGAPTLQLWPPTIGPHPMGQEADLGYDFFARTMRGTQRSLLIAFFVGILSTFIGTMVGALAGYYRGWIEALLMRVTDLFLVIPMLVLAAVLGQIAGGSLFWLGLLLSFLTWMGLARLVRGEVLSIREREFVTAAEAIGASSARIVRKHILPNTVGVIIVNATLSIASVILLESALSYLGFGITEPETSLGQLISKYEQSFSFRPWLFWWPGLLILAIALSINFLGDGLRDAFDPRQKRSGS